MNIRDFEGQSPRLGQHVYIDPSACVIGQVELADDVSVWPGTVIRGDVNRISIGTRSNIQDNSVLHVTHKSDRNPAGHELIVGDDVTIGHGVILHGCRIGHRCLIGMGAIVMDGAVLENEVVVAAGALVPPGKSLKGGYIWKGKPVSQGRILTSAEREHFVYSAAHYVRLKNRYLADGV